MSVLGAAPLTRWMQKHPDQPGRVWHVAPSPQPLAAPPLTRPCVHILSTPRAKGGLTDVKRLVQEPSKLRESLFWLSECAPGITYTKGSGGKWLWVHSKQKGGFRALGSFPIEGDEPEAQALPSNWSTLHTRPSCSPAESSKACTGSSCLRVGVGRGDRRRGLLPLPCG